MTRLTFAFVVLFVGACSSFLRGGFAQPEHRAGDTARLGKVTFLVSRAPSVQQQFSSAVAMRHSFWYEKAAEAWIMLAEGKSEDALTQMRSAADHEDRTVKHPVTPGGILPTRELLGEMLLELKKPAEPLIAFESTLRTAPNRFNSLSGAARAAKRAGYGEKAKTYYAKLLSICEHADGDRPEIEEARSLLAER
jgi:hypothetical protein